MASRSLFSSASVLFLAAVFLVAPEVHSKYGKAEQASLLRGNRRLQDSGSAVHELLNRFNINGGIINSIVPPVSPMPLEPVEIREAMMEQIGDGADLNDLLQELNNGGSGVLADLLQQLGYGGDLDILQQQLGNESDLADMLQRLANGGDLSVLLPLLQDGGELADFQPLLGNGGDLADLLQQVNNGGAVSDMLQQFGNGGVLNELLEDLGKGRLNELAERFDNGDLDDLSEQLGNGALRNFLQQLANGGDLNNLLPQLNSEDLVPLSELMSPLRVERDSSGLDSLQVALLDSEGVDPVTLLVLLLTSLPLATGGVDGIADSGRDCSVTTRNSECFIEEYVGFLGSFWDSEEFDRQKAIELLDGFLKPLNFVDAAAEVMCNTADIAMPLMSGVETITAEMVDEFFDSVAVTCYE